MIWPCQYICSFLVVVRTIRPFRYTTICVALNSSLGTDHTAMCAIASSSAAGRAFFWAAASGVALRFVAPFPCSARMRAAHALAVTCHEYAHKEIGRADRIDAATLNTTETATTELRGANLGQDICRFVRFPVRPSQ